MDDFQGVISKPKVAAKTADLLTSALQTKERKDDSIEPTYPLIAALGAYKAVKGGSKLLKAMRKKKPLDAGKLPTWDKKFKGLTAAERKMIQDAEEDSRKVIMKNQERKIDENFKGGKMKYSPLLYPAAKSKKQ